MPGLSQWKRWILGSPLASARERHERLAIPLALAVFASDALSSTAYATEEILLALAGTVYASSTGLIQFLSLPVAGMIILLMAIVVMSYRQVIHAYPQGGGSYEVAREQLGPLPSQIAAAALLIDYVLTVAVSVSAGVAALTSAGWITQQQSVIWALFFIVLMNYINLRGAKESGRVFAFPAYLFILVMLGLLGYGGYMVTQGQAPIDLGHLNHALTHAKATGVNFSAWILLPIMLKAFSHGCAALTGIEAISNGVQAFKEPVVKNANRTMVIMGVILGVIFIGMTFLAYAFQVSFSHTETIVSQIGRIVFGGDSFLYGLLQVITMIILVLAANTSYSGFPRLASLLSDDGYLPRQLKSLGDRLVFSNGIVFLSVMSGLMVWVYGASTHALLPLYAVGVFLSFSLAQSGMVKHHLQHKQKGWLWGLSINAFGAFLTAIVTILLCVEKFTEGAWIVLVAIPLLVWLFRSINDHYKCVGRQLILPENGYCPQPIEHTVLVMVSSLNKGTLPALEYAKTMSTMVEAVHVELNPQGTQRLIKAWDEWGCGVPLTVLKSPYRSIIQPLLNYVDEVQDRHEHDVVTVIVPEFVTKRFWHNLLHNQTSLLIKTLLRFRKGLVVTSIRYHLEE
jgi:amino acid transporter